MILPPSSVSNVQRPYVRLIGYLNAISIMCTILRVHMIGFVIGMSIMISVIVYIVPMLNADHVYVFSLYKPTAKQPRLRYLQPIPTHKRTTCPSMSLTFGS